MVTTVERQPPKSHKMHTINDVVIIVDYDAEFFAEFFHEISTLYLLRNKHPKYSKTYL